MLVALFFEKHSFMKILGISAFYHDSAAAVLLDGEIVAAAQEERFTRKKHDAAFPVNAIRFCCEYAGLEISDFDAIVFYDKPLLKFERLLETYYAFAPKGVRSFVTAMPVWLKEKMFLKRVIHEELQKLPGYDRKKVKLLFPEHHLSHAASAYFPSAFKEAAVLTIDGVGEWATASICHAKGSSLTVLKELHFPHSLGLFYSAVTYFLGFKVNSGEYKVMGLAPYAAPDAEETKRFISLLKQVVISVKEDGSVWLNQHYFNYATGLEMVHDKKWEKLLGIKKRKPEDELTESHCNLAYALQQITEEAVLKMAAEAKRLTGSENLCMAGGVALNCVANGKLLQSGIFKNIFIQPASGDAGGALGAAMAAHHIYFGKEKTTATEQMKGSYLGPLITNLEIQRVIRKYAAVGKPFETRSGLNIQVSKLITEGKVVGWVQGRCEFGPRALGNRSILADARSADMQKKLNLKIKYREGFRPFAPAVLAEDVNDYFTLKTSSPYMLLVAPVAARWQKPLLPNYSSLPMRDKLYTLRSDFPAITHVDFSARVQTVHEDTNPEFYQLLTSFKQLTGHGLLVNTSFNVRGEPPVCNAEDAYRCFMRTEMDVLVINNIVFMKEEQPAWRETKDQWENTFTLD